MHIPRGGAFLVMASLGELKDYIHVYHPLPYGIGFTAAYRLSPLLHTHALISPFLSALPTRLRLLRTRLHYCPLATDISLEWLPLPEMIGRLLHLNAMTRSSL